MIIVTGGAGLIGGAVVHGLNQRGITDILVVDHLIIESKKPTGFVIGDYRGQTEHLLCKSPGETTSQPG